MLMNLGVVLSTVLVSPRDNGSADTISEPLSGLILTMVFVSKGGLRLFEVSCATRMDAGFGRYCLGALSCGFWAFFVAQDERPAENEMASKTPKRAAKNRCPNPKTSTICLGGFKSHIVYLSDGSMKT